MIFQNILQKILHSQKNIMYMYHILENVKYLYKFYIINFKELLFIYSK